ncbi:MAG: Cytochrome c-type biosis protein CcmG/DsbE, thiol:disulfide oxidoreductase, partial [Cyanobacteria bacterium RYN_339]|nr:Cytochrome c-type biosis protein CcmG/DsbE, thiol:disulfide oxidoreductase [Cyanobacteria bacterium RYN_339]
VAAVPAPAPAFSLASSQDGKPVKLADSTGKVRVVVFWASWSASFQQQAAMLEAMRKTHPELEVVGISSEAPAAINAFLQAKGLGFTSLVDDGSALTAYQKVGQGVPGYPTLFVIDKQGNVAQQHVGDVSQVTLETEINALR